MPCLYMVTFGFGEEGTCLVACLPCLPFPTMHSLQGGGILLMVYIFFISYSTLSEHLSNSRKAAASPGQEEGEEGGGGWGRMVVVVCSLLACASVGWGHACCRFHSPLLPSSLPKPLPASLLGPVTCAPSLPLLLGFMCVCGVGTDISCLKPWA